MEEKNLMQKGMSLDNAKSVFFLTAALVMTVTWAVGATGWTKGLNIVTFVGLGVVLISFMLTRSVLPGVVAHIFSLIIGIGWSFWVTSRLLPPHYSWLERWNNMALRLNHWYEKAMQGGTSYDNLMFILQMSIILWGMGYLTVWFVLRSGKVWQAFIPGGVVLLINLYYAPNDITVWFLLFLILALLLVIRFNLLRQEMKWRLEGIFFRPDIGFDFLRAGFVFSLMVVGLAWLTPPIVDAQSLGLLDEFQGEWREIQNEWNRLYADLDYRDSSRGGDTFGQSMNLGGPRHLTQDPVMDVKVDGVGRYWRATVYDYYSGEGWRSTNHESATLGPDISEVALPDFTARAPITQTYSLYRENTTVLYAMSNPIALSRSAKVYFNALTGEQVLQANIPGWLGEEGDTWAEEITYIRSNATISGGENYQVVSAASLANISQLQAAGTNYPGWVTDRYLQLPNSTTDRTRQLARDLTDRYDNPFDKAQAVERFLRAELIYNEKLTAPPDGIDKVDYTLFTSKEAYCDYYASSMIVMLRSLNIPARFSAGFARGTFKSEIDAFHVINADAHSWVEVFFPNYGWIDFEPTAAQPVIIRAIAPELDASLAGPLPQENIEEQNLPPERPNNIPIDDEFIAPGFDFNIPWFGGSISLPRSVLNWSLLLVGLFLLVLLVGGGFWWRQQSVKTNLTIPRLYQHMVQLAGWMGLKFHTWQTPYEHAAMLQHSLPTHQDEVEAITDQYVYQTFGSGSASTQQTPIVYESNLVWHRLRPEMIKQAFLRRLPEWLRAS